MVYVLLSEVSLPCAFDRMPACHEVGGRPYPHKSPSGSSEKCPSLMTSDGEVLLHGYAVKCDVAPSKTIRNPKVLSLIFADQWSRKMRSPNSSARSPLPRDLSGLGFIELQNGHVFTTLW